MATEQGVVMETFAASARVKTTRTKACEGCSAKGSCHTLGGGGTDMVVEAINEAGAKTGDTILLSLPTSSFLKATFLIYLFPTLGLLAGAAAGHATASFLGFDPSPLSAILGFGSFGLVFWFVKTKGNRMAKTDDYKPRIVRIVKRETGWGQTP